ncbi:unnamed protein product, partial [Didymodactylos carnosus]
LPNQLIETLGDQLLNDKNQILIQILYYVVHNGQLLADKTIKILVKFLCINEIYAKYAIQIFKLLTSRNEIRLDNRIYEKFENLLKNQNDYDIQLNVIETLAYSLQNIPIHDELPNNRIVKLIEDYFQSDTTKEIKYFTCVALNSLIEHGKNLSNLSLDLLKLYAQDDDSTCSKVNVRNVSITALKTYINMCKTTHRSTLNINEIETILNQERLGEIILENLNSNVCCQAGNELLSIVDDGQKSLSTFNMKVLESCLTSDDPSIELKLVIIKIFERVSAFLQPLQINSIINLINNPSLTKAVINVFQRLILFKKSFPIETFRILINFASEYTDQSLKDSVIDGLEAITRYATIPSDALTLVRFETLSKKLRNPKLNITGKKEIVDQCIEYVLDGYKLSTNTMESFEYILKNPLESVDIGETILYIIELAVQNGQKMSSQLIDALSYSIKQGQLNKNRLIGIMKIISNSNQDLITQEIFANSEQDLLENLTDSYSIFIKGTQNGCKLTKNTIEHLATILETKDKTNVNERLNMIQIFKNLAANTETFDEKTIRCLENRLNDNDVTIQKLILNTLKYLPNYKPSPVLFQYLKNVLEELPTKLHIEIILEKCLTLRIQDALHIIHMLLISEYVHEDIHDKPVHLICRDILCSDLLFRIYEHDKYDEVTQFKFYSNLNELEDYFRFPSHCLERDEILIFLIENHSNFTLNDINEILLMIKTNTRALHLIRARPDDWLKQLRINWLFTIMDTYQHIKLNENVIFTDDDAEKIVDLLMIKLNFGLSFSENFLLRLSNINDANELIESLQFLYHKNIHKELDLSEYFTKKHENTVEVKDLYLWALDLECDLIKKKFTNLCKSRNLNEPSLFENIQSIIIFAYLNKWSLEIFEKLFEMLNTKQDEPFSVIIDNFLNTLTIINNYEIKSTILNKYGNNAESIFKLKKSNEWPCAMHKFAVSVSFDQDEREKSLRDLIEEINKGNDIKDNPKLKGVIESLEQKYRNIMLAYNRDSKLCSIGKPINHWDENDVKKWSAYYKTNDSNRNSEKLADEIICVVKRAIYLHNKKQQFEPRTIQILSLLLMLDASDNNLARLAQIKTGEGKSVIIAMFAAIKALNGHKVDIVTTSPLLAKRDAENKLPFYEMLNLTAGENSGTSNVKSCYKNDIVYGHVNDYQFDVLRDEYSLLGTRCKREFDIAIVDEVDSMLIDENSKICRLSGKVPAIDELKILLTLIWQELNRLHEKFVRINDKLYCVTAPFKLNSDGKLILLKPKPTDPNATTIDNGIDDDSIEADNGASVSTTDNQNFIENENADIDSNDLIEVENPFEFAESHIRNYVENHLLKANENNQCLLNIPKHLTTFVKQQLNKWILNAWQAKFMYRENIDYLITNGKDGIQCVVPIDYRNTGIIQTNTSWPDGLHQFLQVKHKLRISAESLTTNFLSNVGYFSRYNKNLFGLTGTLGSKDAQELIRYIYNVDFVIIPSYKYTQFKAFPDKLTRSEQEWLNECTKSIYHEAKINQRAVLVICETKSDTTKIYEKLIEKDREIKKQIKLYTRSDNDEQNAIDNELDCGQIIVATNLAGRGTDIGTTHKVEENGGLHVLVTFLPLNTRVEHQAFGRTSRQGKRGTAQLIVLESSDSKIKKNNMVELKQDRDEQEKHAISIAKNIELKRIEMRDRLFRKYCDLRQELREQENDTYKLDCIEEMWGFWLKTTFSNEDESDNNNPNDALLKGKFEEFRSKVISNYCSNAIFENPFYLILKANEYIFEKKNYDQAIDFLQIAIESDPIFTINARYNLAYALIKQKNENKTKAKDELEHALKIIDEILIPQQEIMLISFRICDGDNNDIANTNQTTNDNTNTKSDIEEQTMNRMNILCLFKSQIEQAKSIIEDAESKDLDVRVDYKKLDDFFSDTNKPTLDIKDFKEGGLLGFFQLTQKEPTPWLSIIAVGLLGIAQAVAGAALIAFTGGAAATIGAMLLSEGIGDMITAIKSAITGEFNWTDYAIQKAISVAITIATCGMGALKETGKAIQSGVTAGAAVVTGKTASVVGTQVVGQFTKEGWKLVGKQIGMAFVKAGAKELIKTVLDKTILTQLSEKINQEISEYIEGRVNNEINDNQLITSLITVDVSLKQTTYQNEIELLTSKILNPQSNRFVNAAIAIAKGILAQLTQGVSATVLKIFTAGKCLTELATFLDDFLKEFRRDLNKLQDKLKIDHLLHTTNPNNIDVKTAKEMKEHLKRQNYIERDDIKIIKQLDQSVFVLEKHKQHENHVVQVCNNIYTET